MSELSHICCDCGLSHKGRVFDIPPKFYLRRVMVFLDECWGCGTPLLTIKAITFKGQIKILKENSGQRALNTYAQLYKYKKEPEYRIQSGTKSREFWYYSDNDNVYNLNGRVVASQEEFCLS